MEKLYKFQGFYFSIQLNITNIKFKYIKKKLSNFKQTFKKKNYQIFFLIFIIFVAI